MGTYWLATRSGRKRRQGEYMAETSQRTRTTITTRVDSPVPKRRSKKKKKETGIGVAAIILALIVGWLVVNHNQRVVVRPVTVRSQGR